MLVGGFQLNGASAPTVLRDGSKVASASKKFTVVRNSAGNFTVTFTSGYPLPALPFIHVMLEQAAAPTADAYAFVVKSTWSQSTRSFQIQVQTLAGAASDGDAGDRLTFLIVGSLISAGVDPA